MMGGMGFGFGWSGLILMFVFWVVIIALAIWLVSRLFPQTTQGLRWHRPSDSSDGSDSPMEVLKHRYASGEITKDEYEQIRHDLES